MVRPGPLLLVDGMNAFLRNYVRSPYMDVNGERMGGTTGMLISVRKMIADFNASNCLVVWDGEGGSQRRRSIYSEYKAGRTVRLNKHDDDMEEDPEARLQNFRKQVEFAKEYLTLLGIPQVRAPGVEADDLIAYIAGKMDHPHGCIIVSTDQDMLQLVSIESPGCDGTRPFAVTEDSWMQIKCDTCDGLGCPKTSDVKVYSPIKKILYDRKTFISEYGVLPENFRIVKALTGDKSDNIEGIKGFGEKTIAKNFPILAVMKTNPQKIVELAAGLKGVLGQRLKAGEAKFFENIQLMDLSEPMLSATAARQARDALVEDLPSKGASVHIKAIRDGISFKGDNFIVTFHEFAIRRRRVLEITKTQSNTEEIRLENNE